MMRRVLKMKIINRNNANKKEKNTQLIKSGSALLFSGSWFCG